MARPWLRKVARYSGEFTVTAVKLSWLRQRWRAPLAAEAQSVGRQDEHK
jgi:hypothetical protein